MSEGIDDVWTSGDGDQEKIKRILSTCAAVACVLPEGEGEPFNMASNSVFQALARDEQIETLMCFASMLIIEAKRIEERKGGRVH